MIAIVLAGASNDGKLFECDKAKYEALIKIGNKSMIEYVVNALEESAQVEKTYVIGPVNELSEALANNNIELVQMGNSLVENIKKGMAAVDSDGRVLVCTSDIPLISGTAIDDFVKASTSMDGDVLYSIVRKIEDNGKYSGVKRTYFTLKEGVFTGGNVVILTPPIVNKYEDILGKSVELRKKPWGLASLLGIKCLVKFAFKTLSIKDIEDRVEKVFSFRGRAVISEHPEVGIDVDKPEDLNLVKKVLEKGTTS